VHVKGPTPTVVAKVLHGQIRPFRGVPQAITEDDGDDVMSVTKGIGLDHDLLADRPLDGESSPVNLGSDSLDDNPLSSVLMCHDRWIHLPPS
jgi:hypothetical protein